MGLIYYVFFCYEGSNQFLPFPKKGSYENEIFFIGFFFCASFCSEVSASHADLKIGVI
jgi:hypothetical protein